MKGLQEATLSNCMTRLQGEWKIMLQTVNRPSIPRNNVRTFYEIGFFNVGKLSLTLRVFFMWISEITLPIHGIIENLY